MNIKGKKIQIKIFDIVVVFIFIFLVISLFFVLFRKQSTINVVVKVNEESLTDRVNATPNWYAQLLHVGMKEVDVFGRYMTEVKGVKTYFSTDKKSVVHLIVTLKVVYASSSRQYTYKGKSVLIGSTIELFLNNLLVKGLIVDIDNSTITNSKRIFAQAQTRYIDPAFPQTEGVSSYIAESIKEGDVMKDSLGHPAVKILKKSEEDAKMTIITANGDVILQKHPMRKDVFLDLEIWGEEIGNRYYLFGDTDFPILIDVSFPFYVDNSLVWLTITKINDIK